MNRELKNNIDMQEKELFNLGQDKNVLLDRARFDQNLVKEEFSKETLWRIIEILQTEIEQLNSDKKELLGIAKELIEISTLLNIEIKAP